MEEIIMKHENIKVIDVERENRKSTIDSITDNESINCALFIAPIPASGDNYYGDVFIQQVDENSNNFNINIVCINSSLSINMEALRLGIKDILRYFKDTKTKIDLIYLVHSKSSIKMSDMISASLVIEDALSDFKMNKNTELWVEKTKVEAELSLSYYIEDNKEEDKKDKDKKKKKKDKDKKKKKGSKK